MRNKKYTVILSILATLESVFLLSIPYFASNLIDSALNKLKDKIILFSILLGIASLVCIILKTISYLSLSRFYLKLEKNMKGELFDKLSKKGFKDLCSYHAPEIEMLYTTDIDNIIHNKLITIPSFFKMASKLILAIMLLIYFDWKFLVVIFISGICALAFAKVYSKMMKPRHKDVLDSMGKSNSFIVESVSNLKIIEAYMAKEYAKEYYHDLLDKEIAYKRKRNNLLYGANSLFYAFSAIVYVGPVIYGAIGIYNEWFTYGILIALIELVSQVENPLISISPLVNQFNLAKTSEDRINKALSIKEMEEPLRNIDFDSIVFDNVSFNYSVDKEVIKNLSFSVNKGETVLLKGPSGIGKTTLFMLLMGFLKPNSGSIYYTHNNEKFDIDSRSISLFSYVPQENILFSGTIKDNLKILTGKDLDSIIEALKISNVYDEIMALPNGIDTELKDRGEGLSLGQIQRILIAAAILHDAPILLLDEFSSALDLENEKKIIDNFKKLNKTIIYITHKQVFMDNDRCILLEE